MKPSERIINACLVSGGLSLKELCEALQVDRGNINNAALFLVHQGKLFQAGIKRYFRYFANKTDADAWDLVAQAAFEVQKAETKERKRISKNARQRKANKANSSGNSVGRPRIRPKKVKQPKIATPPPKPKTRVDLFISKSDHVRAVKKEPTIIWPDSVKVQVYPTPAPRFAVDVPPGWKGQITRDWMDRRLQDSCSL